MRGNGRAINRKRKKWGQVGFSCADRDVQNVVSGRFENRKNIQNFRHDTANFSSFLQLRAMFILMTPVTKGRTKKGGSRTARTKLGRKSP
jgi:hypothetical protein